MKTPRIFGTLVCLVGLAAGLNGCENTATSPGTATPDTSKTAQKAGPAILLALAPQAAAPTRFTLSGTLGTTGSVSVWTSVTLNGVDRSSDFALPASQIVTAPFDLSAFTIAAKRTAQVGEYVLTMTATDSLGNTSRATSPLSLRSKPVAAPPTIIGFGVDNATPSAGPSSFGTKGTAVIETSKATVSYSVSPSAGLTPPASFSIVSGSSIAKQVQISTGAPNGSYTITVTVTDEDGNSTAQAASFCVNSCAGPFDLTFEKLMPDLSVGAQNASPPAFIDVDGATTYGGGAKTAAVIASIDAIFFADATDQISLMSPSYAASNSLGNLSAWSTKQSTVIVDAGTTPVSTVTAAKAIIGTSTAQVAAVESGHYYALKLTNGEYAVIRFSSLSGSGRSATGTITLFVE